eukprot:g14213.t1
MLSFLCVAFASGVYVAALLCASTSVKGLQRPIDLAASVPTPTEAPTAAKDATTMPPDRGDSLGPLVKVDTLGGPHITIVTGGQVPLDPVPVTTSQADEGRPGNSSLASDPGGIMSAPKKVADAFRLQERQKDASPSTSSNAMAARVRDTTDEQEEQLESLECIPCEAVFRKVGETEVGAKVHNITVQIRGEPKSGTTFMYEWAANALMVVCGHIERMYGTGTCTVSFELAYTARAGEITPMSSNATTKNMNQLFLDFDPKRWRGLVSSNGTDDVGSACPCENLDRAVVSVRKFGKHSFPVSRGCPWQHIDNVTPADAGCRTIDGRQHGRRVKGHMDTATCFDANPCKVAVDDRELQMLIMRDPRAVTVSTYFYLKRFPNAPARPIVGESIEDFVERMMPTICRYMHVRYLLLFEKMRDRTTSFFYDESWADPVGWHRSFLSMIGLFPLEDVVEKAADTAIRRDFGFKSPGVNPHLGGAAAVETRTWQDEVSDSLKDRMDEMCRLWLPPTLMKTLGILPQYW